jgi:hypothetical protein
MFRAFQSILPHANDRARSGRRRGFIPSLPESASCLEDRVLLSAAGGKAQAAEVSANMADTAAGKEVTNLFESILQTTPTGAQLSQWVHKLHSGMSVKTLRKDLTAGVQAGLGGWAPTSITMDGDPSASARSAAGTAMPPGLSAPTNTNVSPIDLSQVPAGLSFSRSFTSTPTSTSTSGGSTATPTTTTSSPTTTPIATATPTPTPTATPMPTPTATPMPTPMSPMSSPIWMP